LDPLAVLDVDDVLDVLEVEDVLDVLDVDEVLEVEDVLLVDDVLESAAPTASESTCGIGGAGVSVRTWAAATPEATRPVSSTPATTAPTLFTAARRPRSIAHLRPREA
jgi:hypothetical protein